MNSKSTNPIKAKIKHCINIYVILFFFALFLILFGKGCLCNTVALIFGYAETGSSNSEDEVPSCLSHLALFATKWPIHYHYFTNIHNRTGYIACGYSTLDQMQSACKKLGMNFQAWNARTGAYDTLFLEDINNRFQEWSEGIPQDKIEAFKKGECTPECYVFVGNPKMESFIDIGYYRPKDGYFAISGLKTANCWSETKGERTVYVPWIGTVRN